MTDPLDTAGEPIVIRNARLLTLAGTAPRRGRQHGDLDVIASGHVVVEGDRITAIGAGDPPVVRDTLEIDAQRRVVMPGLVDAHTHACWAGDRLDEWELKRNGATYLEILAAGGGIMSTVRATRAAPRAELIALLDDRLRAMLRGGTTTVEVKSGYGLTTASELEILHAIHQAGAALPMRVIATACIGHAIDKQHLGGARGFIDGVIAETLPAIHQAFPGVSIDAYCENEAWSLDDCIRLFTAARSLGHPIRVHTDQFNRLGMTRWAGDNGAVSVDHLEATSRDDLVAVAASNLFAVMLPCSGFHVDGRYGDGRALIDAGGQLVIATNYNPGTSPCHSLAMAIALAVRHCGITVGEAIVACTRNAAALLDLADAGRLAVGSRADLVLLNHRDERQLGYEFGGNPVDRVVCGGRLFTG